MRGRSEALWVLDGNPDRIRYDNTLAPVVTATESYERRLANGFFKPQQRLDLFRRRFGVSAMIFSGT